MRRARIALAVGVLATVFAASGEITIRSDYPGGNVKVVGIDEANGVVRIAPELRDTQVDMFSTVFIGNSQTKVINGKMVTPRGYVHE